MREHPVGELAKPAALRTNLRSWLTITGPLALESTVWIAAAWLFVRIDEPDSRGLICALLFMSALYLGILSLVGKARSAAGITALLIALIAALSWTKATYLGVQFVLHDLFFLTGHNLWATLSQYKFLAVVGSSGVFAVLVLALLLTFRDGARISPLLRIAAFGLAGVLSFQLVPLARHSTLWDPKFQSEGGAVSTFAESAVSLVQHGRSRVVFNNVGREGLTDNRVSVPSTSGKRPDIVMVVSESVFDPRPFDLPVQDDIADFFEPRDGLAGRLNVAVHGGGTWVSEFAAVTGLDPRSFGDQAYYLPVLMEGRVNHSLMTHLKELGYETLVVYCMNGWFVNAENNYRALGADVFDGTEPHQSGVIWIQRDRDIYQRTLEHIDRVRQAARKPVFALVVTIYNHGPHGKSNIGTGGYGNVRAWLKKAAPAPELAPYRDYYLRLQDNIADYRWLRDQLLSRSADRPIVLTRFGDHQPRFTKEIELPPNASGKNLLYITDFSIEGFNAPLDPVPDWGGGAIDIAYLPALVLAASGVERDAIFEARLKLMKRCKGRYADCDDPLKGRIHRTLIDRGLIQVDEITSQGSS